MSKLNSNPTLSVHLEENRPFVYAHLVKFERPLKEWVAPNADVLYSQKASRYMHITDASYVIGYDDLSTYTSLAGFGGSTRNYSQNYYPNKLISVGSVQDSSENKVSNLSVTLDAGALDATIYSETITFTKTTSPSEYFLEAQTSLSDVGFAEGDIISLVSSNSGINSGTRYKIHSFRNEGKKVRVTEETFPFGTWTETSKTYTISQASTEITALTLDQKAANFVNRQVSVFKAFFYEDEPGVFIGNPVRLFSGIITAASYRETPDRNATITWSCKSHWGDFQQVRGRLGADEYHRALDGEGRANAQATVKPEYASDRGFQHANNAVNIIGLYNTTETKFREIWRNKLFGTKKLEEYEEEVVNEVDLRFNLSAKYIPVVYGVRRLGGTPIFADTSLDASKVYIAETLAEGPIQGILNMYVEDQPLVCISEQDSAVRSSIAGGSGGLTSTGSTACFGRADLGQVLVGEYTVTSGLTNSAGRALDNLSSIDLIREAVRIGQQAAAAVTSGGQSAVNTSYNTAASNLYVSGLNTNLNGITHDYGVNFASPNNTTIEFKSGLPNQLASSSFANLGKNVDFKLQSDYYGANSGAYYWGGEHRLLDTAYTTSIFEISSEQTTVPEIDYVIRGSMVECFNYDGSFGNIVNTESHTWFNIGDTVDLNITVSGQTVPVVSDITIIDKWFYYDSTGQKNYRFRWDLTAQQEFILKTQKTFWMEDDSSHTWTMATYDFKEGATSFTIDRELKQEVTAVSSSGSSDLTVTLDTTNNEFNHSTLGSDARVSLLTEVEVTSTDETHSAAPDNITTSITSTSTFTTPSTNSMTVTNQDTGTISDVLAVADTTTFVVAKNKISLAANSNLSAASISSGKTVIIRKNDTGSNITEITRTVTSYDSTGRILTVAPDLDDGEIPAANDTISILGTQEGRDLRPTTNFALMMYDYLRNKRYGAGLSTDKLDHSSFLHAGRVCDTTSDITVTVSLTSTHLSSLAVGQKYTYSPTISGVDRFKWQGVVKEIRVITTTNTTATATIVFGSCVGKLTNKFNKNRQRAAGDVVWDTGALQTSKVSTVGTQDTITDNATAITAIGLSPPGTAATANNTLSITCVAGTNPVSNYSLYDSDFVTYWKYLGWDSPDQRWVTRHQGNVLIDTSQPVFNVIGGLLDHFNGILSFQDGKFRLEVETKRDPDSDLWWNFLDSSQGWATEQGTLTASEDFASVTSPVANTVGKIVKTGVDFLGSLNSVVRARIKKRTGGSSWTGKLYFSTFSPFGTTGHSKTIAQPTSLDSFEWTTVSWDMSSNTLWNTRYITGLKLELGIDFDVEWISVGSGQRVVEAEDIVGSINLKDQGLSKAFNSLSASIIDPGNNFNNRSVSFFNSDYLKQDRGVVRSGSYKLEGITNYYNARLAVEQTLNKSRFARKISFTLRPAGLALSPGELIRVKYPRFGWDSGKYFRIESLTYQEDCLVSVVALEHDDSIYFIDAAKVSPYSIEREREAVTRVPVAPSSLSATTDLLNGVLLTWSKVANLGPSAKYEIWRGTTSDGADRVRLSPGVVEHTAGTATQATYFDAFTPSTETSFYYWVRTRTAVGVQTTSGARRNEYFSTFAGPAQGTTVGGINNYTLAIYKKTNSSVAPTAPTNNPVYTFSTNSLSVAFNNGWTRDIPNNTDNYIWRIEQHLTTTTDTVTVGNWDAASLFAKNGDSGASVNIIFTRSATKPNPPSASAAPVAPWYDNPPSGTGILWASKGVRGITETNFTWGATYQVEGTSVVEVAVYKLNDTTTPTGGSYNFTTNSLTTTGLTTGWAQTIPSGFGNGDSIYKSLALFVGGPEDTAATATWSTPAVIAFRQDGSIGNDAKTVKLTPSSHVIDYATDGSENSSITFTTRTQGITGTPKFKFLVGGVQKQYTTSGSFTLHEDDEPSIGGQVEVEVEVRENASPDTLLATDTVTIHTVQDGSDAILGFLTNSSHTVPSSSTGTLASGALNSAGGIFQVRVGSVDVTSSCTFAVSGSPSNIGISFPSNSPVDGEYIVTSLTANSATATLQATIPAATAGTSGDITVTAIYSISKSLKGEQGDASPTVRITANYYAITYAPGGGNPSPNAVILTASALGSITSPYFKFTGDGITDETSFTAAPGGASSKTKSVNIPSTYFSTAYNLRVGVSDGDQNELSFDTLSISGLRPGSVGESAAELKLYYSGAYNTTFPSGGPTGVSYSFSTGSMSNIPSGWSTTPPAASIYSVILASTAFVTGTGTATNISFTAPGIEIAGQSLVNYIFKRSASKPSTPADTTHPNVPSTWYDDVDNVPAGTNPLWVARGQSTVTGLGANFTINWVTNWSAPTQIEGRDAATVILTNEAHTVPTSAAGTSVMTGSGTDILAYIGPQPVPYDNTSPYASPSFRVSASGSNITPGAISGSSNTATIADHSSMNADSASITYTITVVNTKGQAETYTKLQTFSKAKEGQEGIQNVTKEIFYGLASSTAPTTPSATSYTFSTGAFAGLSANWSTTPTPITGSNANNFWKAVVTAVENTNASGVSSGSNLTFSAATRLLSGFGDVVDKDESDIDIDHLEDPNNVRLHASYAGQGLNSQGHLTGAINSGGTLFTADEAISIRGGFTNLSTTPLLNVVNAAAALRNVNTSAAQVGLGSVSDITTAQMRQGTTKADVGLNLVDNASGATIRQSIVINAQTGVITGIGTGNSTAIGNSFTTKTQVGLGSVSDITTAAMRQGTSSTDVGLGSVSNITSAQMRQGTSATDVGLGNVTNEAKATMFATPTFTGTVAGVSATHVGLGSVSNITSAQMRQGTSSADVGLGSVSNITTAAMRQGTSATDVGLGNVTNEAKATMFATPTFTGTVVGVSATHVGLGSVSNITTAAMRQGTSATDVGLGSVSNITSTQMRQGTSKADVGLDNVANESAATIRSGVTVGSISSGSSFHSWTIITTDGTTNYNPTSTTNTTTFQWRNGNGTLLKQKILTSTLDTANKDIDVSYGTTTGSGAGSVTMSPSTAPSAQTFRKINLTYSGVTLSLTVSIINMSGWTFK